jgi:hypothetical protein
MSHAYLHYIPPLPKPKDKPRLDLSAVRVYRDSREVCITALNHPAGAEGRKEYKRRIAAMHKRQKGICCLYGFIPECPGKLSLREATFEHEAGRGGGKRDDRIELPDGTWINGVSHLLCNSTKGSRYIPFNEHRSKSVE